METLINTILTNNNFVFNEEIHGFEKENKSYFFTRTITADQLQGIKNKTFLNESEWYHEFLSQFNEDCTKANYSALEKNSSLIILVNSASITEIERLQSQILLIEEDQFYVKKYVIIYTSSALEKISDSGSNELLLTALNNKIAFQSILSSGLTQDQEDYVLLLQVFVKLPFLTLKFNEEEFVSLSEKLETILVNDNGIYQELLNINDSLKDLDFLSTESESEISNLLTLLTNDQN